VGFGLLRLAPRDFWSMTPRELAAAMRDFGAAAAPARCDLDTLMAAYPDKRSMDHG
jgi:uncharacterized phage protein (TIGR02216 family)